MCCVGLPYQNKDFRNMRLSDYILNNKININNLSDKQVQDIIDYFSSEIDDWLLASEKELKDYDVYLYKLVLDGQQYVQGIRKSVLYDFLMENQKDS
ncbi:hypothetical protein [Neisseria gonorrhoeae]|uniref:hypothetical protein n=1 Tax=Neisseria gonorrhoeae TaxID=485 RepID=UPI00214A9C93|nr:hypothetical protein [Neisseria gonorrhoeae]